MWTLCAFSFCVLFGLAIIANVQLIGDGSWFWYATLARRGLHLYSDLKLTLQPLFVLETEATLAIFGDSWLASKIPAVINLIALTLIMGTLVLKSDLSDKQRATILVAAFFLGIRFEAYRFDDYHVASDCFVLASVLLLLRLPCARVAVELTVTVALGILTGLTAMTRINDGAILLIFCSLAVLALASRKIVSVLVYLIGAAVTATAIVTLTGDSLITWATYSLLHVGAIKGGTGLFIADPIHVFTSAVVWVVSVGRNALFATVLVALSWTFLISSFSKARWRSSLIRALLGALITVSSLIFVWPQLIDGSVTVSVHSVLTVIAFALSVIVIIRAALKFVRPEALKRWNAKEVLLLLPLAMMASGSLSSAGFFNDLCMDSAMLLIIYPVVWSQPQGNTRSVFLGIAALAAISGAWYRFNDPASWIGYATFPLFQNRQIVQHPQFGSMIIDNKALRFISNICPLTHDTAREPELLSIPWPYANYYCDIAPWHNYVQTWFDTTTRTEVLNLLDELRADPPEWILYQRQLGTLQNHEALYNNGQRLSQRDLDDYISTEIANGQWRIAYREQYGIDSDWILIRTRWKTSLGRNLLSNSNGSQQLSGWRVTTGNPIWSEKNGQLVVSKRLNDVSNIATDSMLTYPVSFKRDGEASLSVSVQARNLDASPGSGYTVDLFDPSVNTAIASLGWSNADAPTRRYTLGAVVKASHEYLVRLRFNAPVGTVSFSELRIGNSSDSGSTTHMRGWSSDTLTPAWTATARDGGCFNVTNSSNKSAQSTLQHNISFAKKGPVTVQMRVGANSLDASDGYGYVSDLYDATKNRIVASLNVPARESALTRFAFTGDVDPSDSYQVRLQYDSAAGSVSFCRVKVEYGPIATPWSQK